MKRLASVKAEEEELQAGGDTAGTPETAQVTTLTLDTTNTGHHGGDVLSTMSQVLYKNCVAAPQ